MVFVGVSMGEDLRRRSLSAGTPINATHKIFLMHNPSYTSGILLYLQKILLDL